MKRLAFALAGLLAVGLSAYAARDRSPAGAGATVLLLYVGAEDCAPCRTWRREAKPLFLAGLDPDQLEYREVIAPRISQAFDESMWPADLQSHRASAKLVGGVPLWLLIRDGRVIEKAGGLSLWRTHVLPRLERASRRGYYQPSRLIVSTS
jgi:hypothetical protein